MIDFSFQLYSARNFQPYEAVLRIIADLGYAEVEGFSGVYHDPEEFRAALDKNGLKMSSGHFGIDILENDFDGAIEIAGTFGVRVIICPFLVPDDRPEDAEGWESFADRLAAIGEKCRSAGFGFAWHNHDFEFKAVADGSLPQKIILDHAPEIGWEMDVAWMVRGGADPVEWIEPYGPRIVAVHLKDIAPAGECADEDGWADVGQGTVDWSGIMVALRDHSQAEIFIMEHDNPNDIARFAHRSIDYARKL